MCANNLHYNVCRTYTHINTNRREWWRVLAKAIGNSVPQEPPEPPVATEDRAEVVPKDNVSSPKPETRTPKKGAARGWDVLRSAVWSKGAGQLQKEGKQIPKKVEKKKKADDDTPIVEKAQKNAPEAPAVATNGVKSVGNSKRTGTANGTVNASTSPDEAAAKKKEILGGYLYKRSDFVKHWRRRYFRFDGEKLRYYENEGSRRCRGSWHIDHGCLIMPASHGELMASHGVYFKSNGDRMFHCLCEAHAILKNKVFYFCVYTSVIFFKCTTTVLK